MVSPGGVRVSAEAARPNHVVPRRVFDARLVAAARARGVEVRRHRVKGLVFDGSGVVIDGRLRARTVVAADGAGSVVRRLIGLAAAAEKHTAIAVRGYADVPEDDDVQLIAMQKAGWPAYAWRGRPDVCPTGPPASCAPTICRSRPGGRCPAPAGSCSPVTPRG
ncbi:NAD(P)/FAD-dependent oxidoreductase [Nonomuraea aurantiaca]|uniref:NAD(P)/FAD-dependent oxidoreductase n=1 Tax=Nonomuraea aurantiaca TaxID=2878562 RepID=UPI001CD9EA7F|nr:FAD-dependent monooxygenase [Nonomuraea aurantiaca]MCA2228503.1 hypothetical protein [Nonomuraea aurantiaca]